MSVCTDCKTRITDEIPIVRLARCCGGLAHVHCVFERLVRCEENNISMYRCARCAERISTEAWRNVVESKKRIRDGDD